MDVSCLCLVGERDAGEPNRGPQWYVVLRLHRQRHGEFQGLVLFLPHLSVLCITFVWCQDNVWSGEIILEIKLWFVCFQVLGESMAGISHNAKNSNLPEFGDSVSGGSKALCGLTEAATQVQSFVLFYPSVGWFLYMLPFDTDQSQALCIFSLSWRWPANVFITGCPLNIGRYYWPAIRWIDG